MFMAQLYCARVKIQLFLLWAKCSKFTRTQYRKFLKHICMEPRKVAAIPAKAAPLAQREFLTQKLEPCLEEAKTGKRVVFFMDASHFVLSPFLGIVWCFARIFIKAPSDRQRFNVLGALNAITKELTTVCNDTYITSVPPSLLELFAAPVSPRLSKSRLRNSVCALLFAPFFNHSCLKKLNNKGALRSSKFATLLLFR